MPVFVRANDRRHAIALINAGADFHIRETFESAIQLGARAIQALGATADEIAAVEDAVRKRDAQRFELELVGGHLAGRALFSPKLQPAAAEEPRRAAEAAVGESAERGRAS